MEHRYPEKSKLHWPEAIDWMWSYCYYLGSFTDSDGRNYDVGVHIHPDGKTISKATVYGNEPGQYISGEMAFYVKDADAFVLYEPYEGCTEVGRATWDMAKEAGLIPDLPWRCGAPGCSLRVPEYNTTCGQKDCKESVALWGSLYEETEECGNMMKISLMHELGKCSLIPKR